MSSDDVYANFESLEGTSTGSEQTLTLTRRSRHIVITNDHATEDLTFKFNASETEGTVKAGESLSTYFRSSTIIINGTSVPYRIWIYG
jgi:hypothetical protein